MFKFGCRYCAGMGYEDYPQRNKPCRVEGHLILHKKNEKMIADYFQRHPLPEPDRKPIGNWEWTGRGWRNLDFV